MESINVLKILYENQAYSSENKLATFSMVDFAKFYVETKSKQDLYVTDPSPGSTELATTLFGKLALLRGGKITDDGVAWSKTYEFRWELGGYDEESDTESDDAFGSCKIKMSLTKSGLEKLDAYLTQLGS